jgi:hypothetical protein
VGLIARGLELNGIATVVISWKASIIRAVKPPRALLANTERGATIGKAHDSAGQAQLLATALALFKQDAPQDPVMLRD